MRKMTANIIWLPVNKKENTLNILAPSGFMKDMAKVGLQLPRIINRNDIPKLTGMASVFGSAFGDDNYNPYQQILDLLEKYEEIELKSKY